MRWIGYALVYLSESDLRMSLYDKKKIEPFKRHVLSLFSSCPHFLISTMRSKPPPSPTIVLTVVRSKAT